MLQLLARLEYRRQALRRRFLPSFGGGSYLAIGLAAVWLGLTLYPAAPRGFAVLIGTVVLAGICIATVVLAPADLLFF